MGLEVFKVHTIFAQYWRNEAPILCCEWSGNTNPTEL